jgi:ABC-type transporter Mla subunit MlaD
VRAANQAAQAAAATTAMPGDLEDLSGGNVAPDVVENLPDKAELERIRAEVARRVAEMSKSMTAARDAAAELGDKAKGAAARGAADEAAQLERKADAERARMHSLLAELATLESELKDLERAIEKIGDLPPPPAAGAAPRASSGPRAPAPASIDDQLEQLKRSTGGAPPKTAPKQPSGRTAKPDAKGAGVDDELAALKKKMSQQPPKKK